jgi:hypothetical protein
MVTPGLLQAIEKARAVRSNKKLFKKLSADVYKKHVYTYNDLLVTNLAFLHGKLMTFYSGYIGLEETHASAAGPNTLMQLHEYGVFTVDGQGNKCEPDYRERSYISGLIPQTMYPALAMELDKHADKLLFRFYLPAGGSLHTNVTPDVMTDTYFHRQRAWRPASPLPTSVDNGVALTQVQYQGEDEWKTVTMMFANRLHWGERALEAARDASLSRVEELLFPLVGFQIIVRDFCSPLLADEVLLHCLEALNASKVLTDPFRETVRDGGYKHVYFGVK